MPTDNSSPVFPVPAATVLLIRDGAEGIEVFLVERGSGLHFGSALVFPGGKVDPEDGEPAIFERCDGLDSLSAEEAALRVAAVRETFEESGVILARRAGCETVLEEDEAAAFYERYHGLLNAGKAEWLAVVMAEDLILCCDRLAYFAHWITPADRPRRFDTHFFLARAPRRQKAIHDGGESVHSAWMRCAEAVESGESGRHNVMFPTRLNLERLGRSANVDVAMALAEQESVVTVLPTSQPQKDGRIMTIPAAAGYGASQFLVVKSGVITPVG